MLTATLYIYLLSLSAHAFHISVTEILYWPEDKTLQVSVQLFLDDLELALRAETGDNKLDITDTSDFSVLEKQIGEYISQRLNIKTEKPVELNYLGFEYNRDALWCYFEAKKVKKFETIDIRNEILIEAFRDQGNLVHFRTEGKVKSVLMSESETNTRINLLQM